MQRLLLIATFPIMKKLYSVCILFLPVMALLVLFQSCGGRENSGASGEKLDSSALLSQKTEVLNAVDSLLSIMPKPSAVPNIIARTGIEYNPSLLSNLKSAEKVEGNSSVTAFCLGVLGADIAYMASYEKGKEAKNLFLSGKKMADRIGISGAFDASLMEKLEGNLSDRDTLIKLTDGYIQKSSEILRKGEQSKDAALISAGAVIEGLYLAAGLIREYPETGLTKEDQDKILIPLYQTIFEQEASIHTLVFLLEKVDRDDETDKLLTLFRSLSNIYKEGKWNEKIAASQGRFSKEIFEIAELDAAIVKIRQAMVP